MPLQPNQQNFQCIGEMVQEGAGAAGVCLLPSARSGSQNLDGCGKRRNLLLIPGQYDVGALRLHF